MIFTSITDKNMVYIFMMLSSLIKNIKKLFFRTQKRIIYNNNSIIFRGLWKKVPQQLVTFMTKNYDFLYYFI
jgi:hypothetical protein